MKILFWTEQFHPQIGGIEIRVGRLAAELCQRDHQVAVVTGKSSPDLPVRETRQGISIHRISLRQALQPGNLPALHALRREVQEIKAAFHPDLEEVFVSGPMLALQNLCNPGNRIPTITSLQGPLESFLQPGGAVRRLLGSAAAVVTVSEYLKTGVARAMPELCSKLVLIPNSLPAPELPPARLPLHPPVLLCLGRLVHEKGVDLALRAFAILRSRGSPARLVIAGDGEERMNLEALSHALGLSAHVTFTGWVPPAAVAGLINEATMLIVPSRWDEAFGLVNLQAAQMGRPVVAARTGGIPEVVLHGLTGLLVEREDVTGLADAVGNLLDAPESMATMGERARLRAETEFGFATYVDRHIALYREHALPCA